MTYPIDLTRWNRAGLRRFRYIDANAVTMLELLRSGLHRRLRQSGFDLDWAQLVPPLDGTEAFTGNELAQLDQHIQAAVASQRNQHLIHQYIEKQGDFAWELMRAFARACHVLAEHINAHANEAFLRTATQWEHVRQMVETIDYKPAGPSSAMTCLVLDAKPGPGGIVEKGLGVRYTPPGGGEPVIFETLDDLEISADLNELRLRDSDHSEDDLDTEGKKVRFEIPSRVKAGSGSMALLYNLGETDEESRAVRIEQSGRNELTIPLPEGTGRWKKWQTRLAVSPGWSRQAWLNGPDVVRTELPHGLNPGDQVCWKNVEGTWVFAVVKAGDTRGLRFRPDPDVEVPVPGTEIFAATAIKAGTIPAEYEAVSTTDVKDPDLAAKLANRLRAAFSEDALKEYIGLLNNGITGGLPFITIPQLIQIAIAIMSKELKIPSTGESPLMVMMMDIFKNIAGEVDMNKPIGENQPTYREVMGGYSDDELNEFKTIPLQVPYPPPFRFSFRFKKTGNDVFFLRKDPQLRATTVDQAPRYVFNGRPPSLQPGDWVAGELAGKDEPGALKITGMGENQNQNWFWLGLEYNKQNLEPKELVRVHADFKAAIKPSGAEVNNQAVTELVLAHRPKLLSEGRRILLASNDGGIPPREARVAKTNGDAIEIDPPLDGPCTKGNLRIFGNVAPAGHGEARPQSVHSAGALPVDNATLVLEVARVSSVKDAGFPHGMRPDVRLVVEGQTWLQVPRFDQSGPADPHYVVSHTEEGFLRFGFGDGRHGRRLPPGTNNIHIHYRVGAGRDGILPEGALTEMVQPHVLVKAVSQPVAAIGGEDMEGHDRMRERAPATLLALDRAVSLADFENLAVLRNDVWHARAFYVGGAAGRDDLIRVVVMPAQGAPLAAHGGLLDDLEAYLQQRAVPTVRVRVSGYVPQPIDLQVEVRVQSGRYAPEQVVMSVRNALAEAFSLEKQGIGRTLHHAKIYQAIEGVTGVEDSEIVGEPDESIAQRIEPLSRCHAVYIDPDALDESTGLPRLKIMYREYTP